MRGETCNHARKTHERFGHAEAEACGDAEDQTIHGLRKVTAIWKKERRQRFESLLHDWDEDSDEKQRARADARIAKRVAYARVRVGQPPLDQSKDEPDQRSAADREAEHDRRLVAIHLRLVEVDQVQNRNEKRRDKNRGRDEARHVQDEDAREPSREPPAELVDLVLAEMGKQRRENRRLDDVLAGMSGVAVLARLGVAYLSRGSLVRAATGAEHAVRDVVGAVVAAHGP